MEKILHEVAHLPEEISKPVDDAGAKDAGEGAAVLTDYFHPQDYTSVQETELLDLSTKELDNMGRDFIQAPREVDARAEKGSTRQVTGYQLKKESSDNEDELDPVKKQSPRACKWRSWW